MLVTLKPSLNAIQVRKNLVESGNCPGNGRRLFPLGNLSSLSKGWRSGDKRSRPLVDVETTIQLTRMEQAFFVPVVSHDLYLRRHLFEDLFDRCGAGVVS